MNYRAKHYRYHRRKRGAKLAKLMRAVAMLLLAIGIIITIGATGASDCNVALADVMSNLKSGMQFVASGAILEGMSWLVEVLTC